MRAFATAALLLLLLPACPKRVPQAAPPPPRQVIQLLADSAEVETVKNPSRRDDVEIDTRNAERTPRIVATGETQYLRLRGARARLFGDAGAQQGWSVDNFVLIEVINEKGRVVERGAVGFTEGVLIGAERVDNLGRMSFQFEAGEVDITRLLPEGEPFKVRATALDYGGVGRVSDVFLVLDAGPGGGEDDLRGQ